MAKRPRPPLKHADFWVGGAPATQGSVRAFNNPHTNRPVVVHDNPKKLKDWRADIKAGAVRCWHGAPSKLPVSIMAEFYLLRPRSHYGTGRNRELVKASAPARPIAKNRNDADKLARSLLDAMTGVAYEDDSQVCVLTVSKDYGPKPGVQILVREIVE